MTVEEKEEPLDPAVEAIRVKMVRLLIVSGGIMMLGLMAVLAAIVYKITQSGDDQSAPVEVTNGKLSIPKGAQLISTTAAGAGLILTLKLDNGQTIIHRYNAAGALVSTHLIIEQ